MKSEFCDIYDIYEESSDWLRFLLRSKIRIKILSVLNEDPKNLGELRKLLNLSSSTILQGMVEMEAEDLVENTEEGYALTNIGKIQKILIKDLLKSIVVISKDKDFWLNHDISGIPEHLLRRIGELGDCEIVGSAPDDLLKTFSNFIQIVMNAKEMKGVSPIYSPDYPNMVKTLVSKKADVDLVLSRKVLNKILETNQDDLEVLRKIISEKYLRLLVIDEDVKEAFTITDSALSFGLFRKNGAFDTTADLIAHGDEACNWGRELFEYYRDRSRTIGIDDI
ncbi:MAG: winged helix-turn-helix domain-containing protein [Halobacteriota archaeon]|nr:winged helix-turn-helix domain-containing protein [Halobacteriota archaeon]